MQGVAQKLPECCLKTPMGQHLGPILSDILLLNFQPHRAHRYVCIYCQALLVHLFQEALHGLHLPIFGQLVDNDGVAVHIGLDAACYHALQPHLGLVSVAHLRERTKTEMLLNCLGWRAHALRSERGLLLLSSIYLKECRHG